MPVRRPLGLKAQVRTARGRIGGGSHEYVQAVARFGKSRHNPAMAYQDMTTRELVHQLEVAGRYPNPELMEAIWQRKDEAAPLLLNIFREAYHDDWDSDDDPRWYRFVHAGQFMLARRVEEAILVFADLYIDDKMQDWCEWFERAPADFDPSAIPHFARVLQIETGGRWHYGLALSSGILAEIAVRHPETGDQVATLLRALLPPLETIPELSDDEYDENWSSVIDDLAMLSDEASKAQILALFDAEMIDPMFIDRQSYLQLFNEEEIIALTDAFAREYLNEEYAEMCRQLAAKLARKATSKRC